MGRRIPNAQALSDEISERIFSYNQVVPEV
jgi:hypothetical protein